MAITTNWTDPTSALLDLSDGDLVGEVNWDALVSNLYRAGGAHGKIGDFTPVAKATHSANQAIATATATSLSFDSEEFDNDTIHSVSGDTGRLTVRTAGVYLFFAGVQWGANGTGQRDLFIRRNATNIIGYDRRNAAASGVLLQQVVGFASCVVDDFVDLRVVQTSGISINVELGNGTPFFVALRLSA